MSKKRPGVEAALRLCQSNDAKLWQRVEGQWNDLVGTMKNNMAKLHPQVEQLGQALTTGGKTSITKEELLNIIVPWKFAVGKPRPALWKLLQSNTDAAIAECSGLAITLAKDMPMNNVNDESDDDDDDNAILAALNTLTQLQGVGPATASVILSLVRPDVFCYMYDEVIDCFLPKRTYTAKVYLEVNAACRRRQVAPADWTRARVAKTLWMAARISATNNALPDLTTCVKEKRKTEPSTNYVKSTSSRRLSKRQKTVV